MSTLTIRLTKALRRDLEKLGQQRQLPLSDLVRDSIRRYIVAEQFRALREKTMPFAERQGFLTDEDVFKAVS